MIKCYIRAVIKIFPDISSGRKNFKYHEKRVKKNIELTRKYTKKTNKILE
jgi:hypothetical protein